MFRKNARLSTFVVVLLAVAVVVPVAVYAAGGPFTDDDGSIFEADIEWMAANGVTSGCNPPANDNYCPRRKRDSRPDGGVHEAACDR